MDKRLFDYDPVLGITTYHYYDPITDTSYLEEVQEVGGQLDQNKALYNDEDFKRRGIKNEMMHAAHIPNIVIMKWKRELGIDLYNKEHMPKVKALLNSSEYRYLRTTNARL